MNASQQRPIVTAELADSPSPSGAAPAAHGRVAASGTRLPLGLLVALIAGGVFLLILPAGIVTLAYLSGALGNRAGTSLAGQWIHVDQPPSRSAKALMRVGTKVISDQVYTFTSWGSVVREHYYRGARGPSETFRGTWRIAPDQNGGDGELTILLQFPDQPPTRLHVRFVDREIAEFRRHDAYPMTYYRTR